MQILNLACNGHRPSDPFINIDILRTQLAVGTPERTNLDAENNYVEWDLRNGIPYPLDSCDGIFISHFIEHLDAKESIALLKESYRVLVPGGLLLISVPDASYFREVYDEDTSENSDKLFGEPVGHWDMDNNVIVGPFAKFFDFALFYHEHKQILTEDSLWCLIRKGGFQNIYTTCIISNLLKRDELKVYDRMKKELNRFKFSTILWAVK